MDPLHIAKELRHQVSTLRFGPPVTHVYSPLHYAWAPHAEYLRRFGQSPKQVLLLGMNPGPFGMAQCGVPFGEIAAVRGWLGIEAPIGRPPQEHPKRPIQGFDCPRSEVSGARLWGWAGEHFDTPEEFFARFFIANYCPLVFMAETGRNITPDKLPKAEREPLFAACDEALRQTVQALGPMWLVGIGAFAEKRARIALDDADLRCGRILHPSPASPAANRDWAGQVTGQLRDMGIEVP